VRGQEPLPGQLTVVQPASSSIQLGRSAPGHSPPGRVPGRAPALASIRLLDGSVRLWAMALVELIRVHHRQAGLDVLEFQPRIRTCSAVRQ
jgi:hypothetical protein